MDLSILYRGPLESCNYGCAYCPFAKKKDTREELREDRRALERFTAWIAARGDDRFQILITPWGEGLVRTHYQEALVRLSNLPNVARVAIQTNLSCSTTWLERANLDTLALWATFHPEWTTRERFVAKVRALDAMGVRMSAGVVGFRAFAREIELLRGELPERVYLWINAVKSGGELGRGEAYLEDDVARFERVDPLFRWNTRAHPSLGRACRAGESVIAVDGNGDVRRCHFIEDVIANIYRPGFEAALVPRACTNATCGCHIGYVHMDDLGLYDVYEGGVLERIPRRRLALA